MPASPSATAEHIKDVNTRYHDAAAAEYDAKWGIDFGEIGQRQVAGKLRKATGEPPGTFADALEIGAGTGYFGLNLLQSGTIGRLTATDISPGMLDSLRDSATRLGVEADTAVTEAESLPFADRSFDLVVGHAILHHIPDLPRAFGEFRRVLRPGGAVVFCGEPSRHGDRIAAVPKRIGHFVAPAWRAALRAGPAPAEGSCDGHELEPEVDVHSFSPGQLAALLHGAGFVRSRVRGEELLANAWGWTLRSLEATAEPSEVPFSWRRFGFRSYMALQRIDTALLEPRLPPQLFYNLLLSARKPA
ncbi:MAG: class I SAM-dependent methyltransferase [Solirubrobacterales bacterium]